MQKMVALTPEELLRLLTEAKRHSAKAHCMCLLGFRHALRASEITTLRMEDLNLREGTIRCRRLKNSLTTTQVLENHPGQPLLDEPRVVRTYLRTRVDDGSGVLFISSHGAAMNRSTFFRLFRRLAQAAGLPPQKQHPHTLKHAAGSILAAQNVGAFTIQRVLGHRSISSSMVYAQVSDCDASRWARTAFMQAF